MGAVDAEEEVASRPPQVHAKVPGVSSVVVTIVVVVVFVVVVFVIAVHDER